MTTEMDEKAQMLRDANGYREMEANLVATLRGLGYVVTEPPARMLLSDDLPLPDIEDELQEMDNRLSAITYSLGLPEYLFMTSTFVSDQWTRPRPRIDDHDWSTDAGDIPIPPPPTF